MDMDRSLPLIELPGVGPARAKALSRLGLVRVGDLLRHFPQRYEDRRQRYTVRGAPLDEACCVCAMVAEPPRLSRIRRGLEVVKAKCVDATGVLYVTFFNQTYVRDALKLGESYVFYGKLKELGRARSVANPAFEREGAGRCTGLIMPVYPLTAGVSNNLLSGLTRRALEGGALEGLAEALPEGLRAQHGLCGAARALRDIHYPPDFEALSRARRRLVFEEFFTLGCALGTLRGARAQGRGRVLRSAPERFAALLPFTPTAAQRRAMEDLGRDLRSGGVMNRLVQGDVGSGKTAVAAFGAWAAAKNGCQCALMAPTELLAEQHYQTLSALLSPEGVRVGRLTGAVKGARRREVLSALEAGELDLVIGTHALFSEGVRYANLGLVVADEQHRFGVAQRSALAGKAGGCPPHVLVMSATPIPRTLALIIYGDLDVSVIDELPPGRTPVATYVVGEDKRQRLYNFVRRLVREGRQAYIVCPAVEPGDAEAAPEADPAGAGPAWGAPSQDLKAVTEYAAHLRERVFPDLRVGLVHGKLKTVEKEEVMGAFARGELDVLVATTVVEVGVDVPNAALMVVENAERFGLSQLHQLRGRVGRGRHQSYCVLLTASGSAAARERLRALCATNDGFKIAEEDLRLRGPGDFFGKRQHGLPQLKVADFASDVALLEEARQAASELAAADPGLKKPEHAALRRRVKEMFAENPGIFAALS